MDKNHFNGKMVHKIVSSMRLKFDQSKSVIYLVYLRAATSITYKTSAKIMKTYKNLAFSLLAISFPQNRVSRQQYENENENENDNKNQTHEIRTQKTLTELNGVKSWCFSQTLRACTNKSKQNLRK